MTIEEAIKYAEEVAKENDDSAKEFYRVSKLETHPDRKRAEDEYVECKKCAEEHRQLAEWLRDYKRLKEQESCDAVSRQSVLELVGDYDLSMGQVVKGIHALPSVILHSKTGHWIPRNAYLLRYRCSECGRFSEKYNFCPYCGVKMLEIPTD